NSGPSSSSRTSSRSPSAGAPVAGPRTTPVTIRRPKGTTQRRPAMAPALSSGGTREVNTPSRAGTGSPTSTTVTPDAIFVLGSPAGATAARLQRLEARGHLSAFPQLDHARERDRRSRRAVLEQPEIRQARIAPGQQPRGQKALFVEPQLRHLELLRL